VRLSLYRGADTCSEVPVHRSWRIGASVVLVLLWKKMVGSFRTAASVLG